MQLSLVPGWLVVCPFLVACSSAESQGDCDAYIECSAAVTPNEMSDLLDAYGSEGSCWTGDADQAETCRDACTEGLGDLANAYPDEPDCATATDTDTADTDSHGTSDWPVDLGNWTGTFGVFGEDSCGFQDAMEGAGIYSFLFTLEESGGELYWVQYFETLCEVSESGFICEGEGEVDGDQVAIHNYATIDASDALQGTQSVFWDYESDAYNCYAIFAFTASPTE